MCMCVCHDLYDDYIYRQLTSIHMYYSDTTVMNWLTENDLFCDVMVRMALRVSHFIDLDVYKLLTYIVFNEYNLSYIT